MDREWAKSARESDEFQNGLDFFLDYAYTKGKPCGKEILCPCVDCYNRKWFTRDVVQNHLIAFGFQKGYDTWVRHGEQKPKPGDLNDNRMNHEEDQIDGLLHERFRDVVQEENDVNVGLDEDAKKFYNLVEEAKQDLYPGCKNFSKLSFIIRLYLVKCLYGWSNVSFNALLELLREALPLLNIPDTFNKCMIKDLGLDYKKIDACPSSEEHANEVKQLMQEMEEKRRQDKEATERKCQLLLKAIVNQNTANFDIEAIATLISASTSTHAPNDNEMMNNDDINEEVQDFEDEKM